MRSQPGLFPGPHWGSSQHSPCPLAGIKGVLCGRGRREGKGRRKEMKGREGRGKGQGWKKEREEDGRREGKGCIMALA